MSFPRYLEYKDSGVEWLGEVPSHWNVLPLKRLVEPQRPITYGIVQAGPHVEDGVPYIRPADLDDERGVLTLDNIPRTSTEIADTYKRSTIEEGDLVCSIGPSFGKVMLTPGTLAGANLTQGTARIAIAPPNVPRYVFWLLRSASTVAQWESSIGGATFRALNLGPLAETIILRPPSAEQVLIADFLDRETAKIDALIAEQERLIELLKEKRQAVISHAVTKGFDPNVPMKDSGVEWLGDVPAHWRITPLKRALRFLTSGSRGWAEHYADDGALFIRIGNLTRESIELDLSDLQRVDVPAGAEGERTRVSPGDVLFSITAYLGSVAVVPKGLETAYVSQHVALARLGEKLLLPEWVGFVTLSHVGKTYLASQGYGGTKIQLSLDDIANMLMTVPPIPEQATIIRRVDQEIKRFAELIGEADNTTALLRERRAAIVSAAVTGQIDVRGQAEAEAA